MCTLSGFAQNPAVQYEQDILIREYQLLNKLVPKNSTRNSCLTSCLLFHYESRVSSIVKDLLAGGTEVLYKP
jgi:hypothetical protein